MAIPGTAATTATATATAVAGPGPRGEKSLGRSFVGDMCRSPCDLATAAGAAPRLHAVRCTLRGPRCLITSTASRPLLPAAPVPELAVAGPGPRGEKSLGRRFVGDLSRATCDLATAVGTPRLPAVRCTLRGPRCLITSTASRPLLPAAPAREFTATTSHHLLLAHPGAAIHTRKPRQQVFCGKKPLPPPETPRCFTVAVKLSSGIANEVVSISRFLCHWIKYMLSRLEMEQLRLETRNVLLRVWSRPNMEQLQLQTEIVLRRALFKILYWVVSVTNDNETPSVDVDVGGTGPARSPPSNGAPGHIKMKPPPPPETPLCLVVAMKLSRELGQEVLRIARFLLHWTEYIWSGQETENLQPCFVDDPSSKSQQASDSTAAERSSKSKQPSDP